MAWDPSTGQMILFGGSNNATIFSDTWLWNGTNWAQLTPTTRPTGRLAASLIYDAGTAQMLFIDGLAAGGVPLGDVWTWSGATWSEAASAPALPTGRGRSSPAQRFNAFAGYDAATQQMLLFGGDEANTYLADTWLWTPFAVGEPTVPPATVGLRYTTQLDAIAGTPRITWSVSAGTLPAGLALSPAGSLNGTPRAAGAASFTVSVADAAGHTASRAYTLTVNAAPMAGVWVSNGGNSQVHAFGLNASGNATPTVTLSGALTQLNSPAGLALDAAGDLYVANTGTPSVTEYGSGSSGNVAPLNTITGTNTGLVDPSGIALDPTGRVYVANGPDSSVTVYAAGASGNVAPVQRIAGPLTLLRQPLGIVIDAQGHVWVSDYANDALVEFASNADGDVAPLAEITGVLTGLNGPGHLALTSAGRLLASNFAGGSVTEYATAGPFGDVLPDFTISGGTSQISLPEGVDADAAGDVYLANEFGGINRYASDTTVPVAVISGGLTGLSAPQAVAVAPPMMVADRSLPDAGLNRPYSTRLAAVLGSPPLRWRVVGGHLPAGLRLSRSGDIAGVTRTRGRFAFTVSVASSSAMVPPAIRRLRESQSGGRRCS